MRGVVGAGGEKPPATQLAILNERIVMTEHIFTFKDGTIYFYIYKEKDIFRLSIGDKDNGSECFIALDKKDLKKMIDNFSEIIQQ